MNFVVTGLKVSSFILLLLVSGCGFWVSGDGGHVHPPPPLDRLEIVVDDTLGPDLPTEKKGMKPMDRGSYYGFVTTIFKWDCDGNGCSLLRKYNNETRP